MSELFDKEVNAQKESLKKKLPGFTLAHEKVCNENKTKKQEKNDGHLKYFLMEGRSL